MRLLPSISGGRTAAARPPAASRPFFPLQFLPTVPVDRRRSIADPVDLVLAVEDLLRRDMQQPYVQLPRQFRRLPGQVDIEPPRPLRLRLAFVRARHGRAVHDRVRGCGEDRRPDHPCVGEIEGERLRQARDRPAEAADDAGDPVAPLRCKPRKRRTEQPRSPPVTNSFTPECPTARPLKVNTMARLPRPVRAPGANNRRLLPGRYKFLAMHSGRAILGNNPVVNPENAEKHPSLDLSHAAPR